MSQSAGKGSAHYGSYTFLLFLCGSVQGGKQGAFRFLCAIKTASCRYESAPGAITKDDVERFKQAFARPGSLTAAINYYRAAIDAATWAPPTTKRHAASSPWMAGVGCCHVTAPNTLAAICIGSVASCFANLQLRIVGTRLQDQQADNRRAIRGPEG